MGDFYVTVNKVFEGYKFKSRWQVTAGNLEDAAAEAPSIGLFEKQLAIEQVLVGTLIVSNSPDPTRGDFITVHYNQLGAIFGTADSMAVLDIVLWVDLQTDMGRYGRKFLRGCLFRDDVAPDGALIKPVTPETYINRVGSNGGTLIQAYATGGQSLMVGKTFRAPVTQITFRGMTTSKTNHRWFNRAH